MWIIPIDPVHQYLHILTEKHHVLVHSAAIQLARKADFFSYSTWYVLVREAEKLYFDNPYHSFRHSVNVTFSMLYMLDFLALALSPEEKAQLLVCAIFHDALHIGKGNIGILEENPFLRVRWGSSSILEAMSLKHALRVCREANLKVDNKFESLLEYVILATDINVKQFSADASDNQHFYKLALFMRTADVSSSFFVFVDALNWSFRIYAETKGLQPDKETALAFLKVASEEQICFYESYVNGLLIKLKKNSVFTEEFLFKLEKGVEKIRDEFKTINTVEKLDSCLKNIVL